MHFIVETLVKQDYHKVFKGFDQDLFLKLSPPGIKVELLQFDGCKKGDIVELQLSILLFKQRWKSTITESGKTTNEYFFVDEARGKDLPFFLKEWKHYHRIINTPEGTKIIDDITYKGPLGISRLLYPILKSQFNYRKPIYQKLFA
ncbi:MAG: hypothetical protein GY810_29900 [Aureispira sp.]|nr:hypothetical protein [Aureispira sp.]